MTKERVLTAFEWLCLFLFLISLSIILTISFTPLYKFFVIHDDLGKNVGLTNSQLISEYYRLLEFLNFPWVNKLNLSLEMSYKGLSHFYDVKRLFLVNHFVFLVTLPVSILFLAKIKRRKQFWRLILPFKLAMAAVAFAAVMMVLQFNTFFVDFHRILFRNNDWLFDPALDPIINALPDTFFMACFVVFFLVLEFLFWFGVLCGRKSL
ncbi:intergral membrane protein [Liquorilactobacillus sucicola DSM 21376 = JCM 15457]|uniref:Intergral membrane protein n=1 Tax=Liquorilactobacillus sucicola DSM 21376 = JCM 15457 TaxID=1423806 RepID=A0A0R2DXI4_9LACO|nr:TIGR01906 family membrane protein [Liquorilactobacillus sucicola]KRN06453.1 intergral membrane protein [Liquorilactobacillus sucicola DSM 21376 = JCM 15457]